MPIVLQDNSVDAVHFGKGDLLSLYFSLLLGGVSFSVGLLSFLIFNNLISLLFACVGGGVLYFFTSVYLVTVILNEETIVFKTLTFSIVVKYERINVKKMRTSRTILLHGKANKKSIVGYLVSVQGVPLRPLILSRGVLSFHQAYDQIKRRCEVTAGVT